MIVSVERGGVGGPRGWVGPGGGWMNMWILSWKDSVGS